MSDSRVPGIYGFSGKYRFLSNFWPCSVKGMDGRIYPSLEHAYQAAKAQGDLALQDRIFNAQSASEAKRLGRSARLRSTWDSERDGIMLTLSLEKYTLGTELAEWLLGTGDLYLEETNTWGDRYWGVCNMTGLNRLGETLMEVRSRLRAFQAKG